MWPQLLARDKAALPESTSAQLHVQHLKHCGCIVRFLVLVHMHALKAQNTEFTVAKMSTIATIESSHVSNMSLNNTKFMHENINNGDTI